MTLVSIITPSFNQKAYLEQTIRSVLEQDYPHIEYMVVDGGSNDGSLNIIENYAHKLAWWVSEKDSGQADAINKGFARARGEIVAWLNSDDYYLPGTLKAVVQAFDQHPEAVLIYGNMLAVDQYGRTINLLKYPQVSLEDLLCFQILGQPAVFVRHSTLKRAALPSSAILDPSFHFMLDHHLWIRIAAQGRCLHLPYTWSAARYHPAAKNIAQPAGFARDAFRILDYVSRDEKLAPVLERVRRRARASAYRVNARYFLDAGQSWSGLTAWLHSLLIHPPTALARLNLLASALLLLAGLGGVRHWILRRRSSRFN